MFAAVLFLFTAFDFLKTTPHYVGQANFELTA